MHDKHFLALGRAVYAFQVPEWLAIWSAALLDDDAVGKVDGLTFGNVIGRIETRLANDPAAGGAAHGSLVDVVPLLGSANQLRQDVLHSHPVLSDEVLRRRPKTGDVISIDVDALDAARLHFEQSTVEMNDVFHTLGRQAMDGQ
jgi:hypothetical protein